MSVLNGGYVSRCYKAIESFNILCHQKKAWHCEEQQGIFFSLWAMKAERAVLYTHLQPEDKHIYSVM